MSGDKFCDKHNDKYWDSCDYCAEEVVRTEVETLKAILKIERLDRLSIVKRSLETLNRGEVQELCSSDPQLMGFMKKVLNESEF